MNAGRTARPQQKFWMKTPEGKENIMKKMLLFMILGMFLATGSLAGAQTAQPAANSPTAQTNTPRHGRLHARIAKQQQRIARGLKKGRLNQIQVEKLNAQESAIHATLQQARLNNGRLDKEERLNISAQLKNQSQQIYLEKHQNSQKSQKMKKHHKKR
jgi:hypothetical protein